MRDFVKKPSAGTPQLGSAVVDAIDAIVGAEPRGPMETEVLKPLVEVVSQVAQLREGRFGSLTLEQRQALNLVHGKLGHVLAVLGRLTDGTAVAAESAAEALASSSRSTR